MRSATAISVSVAILWLVSGLPLLRCPFLNSKADTTPMACCPRQHSAPQQPTEQKCPYSRSLENCPFFVTEGKIGWAETKVETTSCLAVSAVIRELDVPMPPGSSADDFGPDQTATDDLHIRYRVLRI